MEKKVLLVSEDKALATALDFDLGGENSLLRVCKSKTALEEAAAWFPQVVIIDGALPGKESLKVCRSLKSSHQLGEIPAIILGIAMNSRNMSTAYKSGADFYVLKQGDDRRALLLTIQTLFRLHQRVTAA
jgi:CheY-like chemotaxis protein